MPRGSYYFILELGENINDGSDRGTIKGVLLVVPANLIWFYDVGTQRFKESGRSEITG
jgi:hypothetical protein